MTFRLKPPGYESCYFDNVLAACNALQIGTASIPARIEELKKLPKNPATTCELELLQLRLDSAPQLVQSLPNLRARWAAMSGDPAKTSDPAQSTQDQVLAEASFLTMQIHRHYCLQDTFEDTKRWILQWMFIGLIVLVGVCAIAHRSAAGNGVMAVDIATGILGGYTSSLWRMFRAVPGSDLVTSIQATLADGGSVIVKPALGGVFAVVLHLLFVSHLITGPMFPDLTIEHAGAAVHFADFFNGEVCATSGEFAKLLIWCFLGGFAERLVPDVLDSLSTRAAEAAK